MPISRRTLRRAGTLRFLPSITVKTLMWNKGNRSKRIKIRPYPIFSLYNRLSSATRLAKPTSPPSVWLSWRAAEEADFGGGRESERVESAPTESATSSKKGGLAITTSTLIRDGSVRLIPEYSQRTCFNGAKVLSETRTTKKFKSMNAWYYVQFYSPNHSSQWSLMSGYNFARQIQNQWNSNHFSPLQ